MRTNTRLEAVEAIYMRYSNCHPMELDGEVIRSMKKLRLLHVIQRFTSSNPTHLPDELRCLTWEEYPFHSFSLLTATGTSKLAYLAMTRNHIEQLSLGETILHSLKFIDFSFSSNLTRFPDISGAPNLERLDLSFCSCLVEVHESVGSLKRLVYLDLCSCKRLKIFPSSLSMKSLQTLILCYCRSLESLPEISGDLGRLSFLDLSLCSQLKEVPSSFRFLTGLTVLNLCGFSPLRGLANTICHFSRLKVLKLDDCDELEELPELPPSIQVLEARYCTSLRKIGDLSNKYKWLYKISFFGCPKLVEDGDTRSYLANFFGKSFMQKCAVANHRLNITIPVWRVTNWFRHQRFGNAIASKLPPSCHTTIKGLAICCVVPPFGINEPKLDITFELKVGDHDLVVGHNQSLVRRDDELHVWMGYIPFDMFQEKIYHDKRPEDWSHFDETYLLVSLSSDGDPLACWGCIIYKEEVEEMPKVIEPFLPDCTNFILQEDFLGEIDIADVRVMNDSLHKKYVCMRV